MSMWCDRCVHDKLQGGDEEACETCCVWDNGTEFHFQEIVPPKYPEYIMKKLRQRLDLDEDDKSKDAIINSMSKNEVFDAVLEWEGIIGYSYRIKGWISDIYGIELRGW